MTCGRATGAIGDCPPASMSMVGGAGTASNGLKDRGAGTGSDGSKDMRISVVVAAAMKVQTMADAMLAANARATADQSRTTVETNTATATTVDMSMNLRAAAVVRAWGERLLV